MQQRNGSYSFQSNKRYKINPQRLDHGRSNVGREIRGKIMVSIVKVFE